jgi:hypothetical protein
LDLHRRAVSNVGEGVDIGRATDGATRVEDGDTFGGQAQHCL